MPDKMNPAQIAAMVANLRAFNTDASRNVYADALEAQAADIIEEQRISTMRGNHIEFTLLPENAALTMQLADRDAEIARLTAVNEALHQAQTYSYIGKHGKPILARDLEDQRDEYEDQLATLIPEINREAFDQRTRAEAAEAKVKALVDAIGQEATAVGIIAAGLEPRRQAEIEGGADPVTIGEQIWAVAMRLRAALDAQAGATVKPLVKSGFRFDRYICGSLMAEGVTIEACGNLADAMRSAARLACRGPNGEIPVLVYAPLEPTSAPAELLAAALQLPEVKALVDAANAAMEPIKQLARNERLNDRDTPWIGELISALAPFAREGEFKV